MTIVLLLVQEAEHDGELRQWHIFNYTTHKSHTKSCWLTRRERNSEAREKSTEKSPFAHFRKRWSSGPWSLYHWYVCLCGHLIASLSWSRYVHDSLRLSSPVMVAHSGHAAESSVHSTSGMFENHPGLGLSFPFRDQSFDGLEISSVTLHDYSIQPATFYARIVSPRIPYPRILRLLCAFVCYISFCNRLALPSSHSYLI